MADDEAPDRARREIEPPPPLADALRQVLRRIAFRGRQEVGRAATEGRTRLELRQLQHDRDQFWIRMGKSAYHLVEGGEIDHPALRKAMQRIDELEASIRGLQPKGGGTDDAP